MQQSFAILTFVQVRNTKKIKDYYHGSGGFFRFKIIMRNGEEPNLLTIQEYELDIGLSLSLLSERCTEPADCRKRREFLSMSDNDKHRFIDAFMTVSTHSDWKHRFNALARIHFENFLGKTIHSRHEFLPWHRWYVLFRYYRRLHRMVNIHG